MSGKRRRGIFFSALFIGLVGLILILRSRVLVDIRSKWPTSGVFHFKHGQEGDFSDGQEGDFHC